MTVAAFWEVLPPLVTAAECDELLALRAELPAVRDRFASVQVTPVPPEAHRALYERIYTTITAVNDRAWRVALDGWLTLQFLAYGPGDHYPWHTDLADPRAEGRVLKLALSCLLTAPETFQGGDLELMIGTYLGPGGLAGPAVTVPLERRGAGLLFPSYLVHRVQPVTAGTRTVLVARLGGPTFR